jgi:hypothetical protein
VLTGAAGRSNVLLRITFASDEDTPEWGYAFDNITIFDPNAPPISTTTTSSSSTSTSSTSLASTTEAATSTITSSLTTTGVQDGIQTTNSDPSSVGAESSEEDDSSLIIYIVAAIGGFLLIVAVIVVAVIVVKRKKKQQTEDNQALEMQYRPVLVKEEQRSSYLPFPISPSGYFMIHNHVSLTLLQFTGCTCSTCACTQQCTCF